MNNHTETMTYVAMSDERLMTTMSLPPDDRLFAGATDMLARGAEPSFPITLDIKIEDIIEKLEGHVLLTREKYEELVDASNWVTALDCAGVDNWCGYDHAQEIYREMQDEEDDG